MINSSRFLEQEFEPMEWNKAEITYITAGYIGAESSVGNGVGCETGLICDTL